MKPPGKSVFVLSGTRPRTGSLSMGKSVYRGANRHQAFANVGDAASNSMQVRDVIDLKRGGYNAVRRRPYPNDRAFLEACDEYGLLVVECIPGWQFYNPDSTFIKRVYEIGRQMIHQSSGSSCIVLWETALNNPVIRSLWQKRFSNCLMRNIRATRCIRQAIISDMRRWSLVIQCLL
ncbi:MAG: glycoside hydrolase family 2 TIM barrel-domain containing protein [Parabacteroides johnsonii]